MCVCVCVPLRALLYRAAESRVCQQRQLLSDLLACVSSASHEGSDQTGLVKHRLSPSRFRLQDLWNQPRQARKAENLQGIVSAVETGYRYSTSSGFSAVWLLKFSCFLLPHICARIFKKIHHRLMLNPLIFLKTLLRNPKLAKKKGFAGIQMGINGRSVWKLHFN